MMNNGNTKEEPSTKPINIEDLSVEDEIIAVMGPSGAGKSSFINMATGSREPVNAVESCTRKTRIVKFHSPDKSKQDVVLVDTPGFSHDHMADAEVLNVIADWLKATYERNIKLTGILYFHKIYDRSSGTHRRNVDMFEKLCGKDALQNVIIITTMWDTVGETRGLEQEEILCEETYWRAITNRVSRTARYLNSRDSAWDILDSLLRCKHRCPTRLQTEMVDMRRELHETAAGRSWGVQARTTSRFTLAAMVALLSNLLNLRNRIKDMQSLPFQALECRYTPPQVMDVGDLSGDDTIIALVGLTGAGKSSFINMATGNDWGVGHGLESCTKEIGIVKVHDTVLVDTPGFDNANRTDRELLHMIADWLAETYKRDIKLAGILYLHRISDNRVSGAPLQNLRIFERLCGRDALQNVILTTTMWDTVDAETGLRREEELRSGYWKGMINQGSKTFRYRNTRDSAWDILDSVIGHRRLAVLLQKELVDMERQLRETHAGQTLYKTLETLMKEQKQKLEEIRVQTIRQSDSAVLKQLQDEYETLHEQLQTTIYEMQALEISVGKRFLRYFTSAYRNRY